MITTIEAGAGVAAGNKAFMNAYGRQDAAAIAALYTKDALVLPPGSASVSGRRAIEQLWKSVMAMGVARVELKTIDLEPYDAVAVEAGQATLFDASDRVLDIANFVVVWKLVDGAWKLHRDIWNSATPPGGG